MDIWNAAMAQISSIIRRGHAARLSDKAFLEREITAWLHSPARQMQVKGVLYYEGQHDILRRPGVRCLRPL